MHAFRRSKGLISIAFTNAGCNDWVLRLIFNSTVLIYNLNKGVFLPHLFSQQLLARGKLTPNKEVNPVVRTELNRLLMFLWTD